MVIFNTPSAEIKTKSADVLLKITTILKELRIAQLRFKSKRTLAFIFFSILHASLSTHPILYYSLIARMNISMQIE